VLERLGPVLRVTALLLSAVVVLQLARLALHRDPLAGVRIPTILASAASASSSTARAETNLPPAQPVSGRGPTPVGPSALPPAIQERVDRITQSEIFGPVMRPPPMALLGIAGKDVFFRAPNGQTGLLREGEELGGVKLLQVGTNRVVIQQDGQNKELSIFSGFGSETLLPKGKENSQ
jgi:hypothetical protein